MTDVRFYDSGQSLYDFLWRSEFVLIQCPYCLGCAKGIKIQGTDYEFKNVCSRCGILRKPIVALPGKATFMGFNLWLKTNCCGNLLWAYNKEHLDFLDQYITSTLRERIPNKNQSLASRLPDWIKNRKNRQELIKGVERLRDKLGVSE